MGCEVDCHKVLRDLAYRNDMGALPQKRSLPFLRLFSHNRLHFGLAFEFSVHERDTAQDERIKSIFIFVSYLIPILLG